jgi:flagellar protein FlbD
MITERDHFRRAGETATGARAQPTTQVGRTAAEQITKRPMDRPRSTFQGWCKVIIVTRLNGPAFALNPDLVERAESTPDTVVTLVDGTKYVIAEPVEQLITLIRGYRASVIAAANAQETTLTDGALLEHVATEGRVLSVIPMRPRER